VRLPVVVVLLTFLLLLNLPPMSPFPLARPGAISSSGLPAPGGPDRWVSGTPRGEAGAPALTGLGAGPTAGASDWVNVTLTKSGSAPPAGYAESVSYDVRANATVLFGGCLATQCPSNQTWIFSSGRWTNVTDPSRAPPARESASMDFDANMGGLLLFGGEGLGSTPRNDTWLFQDGAWTNVSYVGPAPAPRYAASLAFDPEPEENGSVLYGGCVSAFLGVACFNDTWLWAGWSGWIPMTPSALPPAIGFAAMAFDPADGAVVLYGGCTGTFCGGVNNQTWELYSGQWWETSRYSFPPPRSQASMVFDPVGHQLLLFGGVNATFVLLADTWSFANESWHLLSTPSAPSARFAYGLALDGTGSVVLLVGGETNGPNENDTWVYASRPAVALSASALSPETSQSITFTASLTGGTGPFRLTESFGDGSNATVSGAGPVLSTVHAYSFVGRYMAVVNLTDSVGVTASANSATIGVTTGPAFVAGATPAATDVGLPIQFTTNVSNPGSSALTYAWAFGDTATGTGAGPSHAYSTAGHYRVAVTGTDSVGGTAGSSVGVQIAPLPSAAVSVVPAAPNTTGLVTFQVTVVGGTGPFHYSWRFSDGTSSVVPSPTHRFVQAGSASAELWVNDSVGSSVHTSATFTVPPTSSGGSVAPTGSGAAAPPWFWAGIGAVVAVAVVGTVLLVRRRC
jgi:PKD domain-containing protein